MRVIDDEDAVALIKQGANVEVTLTIIPQSGTSVVLTGADIIDNGMSINLSGVSDKNIEFGSVVAAMLDLKLYNNGNVNPALLEGSTINVVGTVYIDEDNFVNFPMGVFNCYEVNRTGKNIALSAFDNMIKFDKLYESGDITFPITVKDFVAAICNNVGVVCATDLTMLVNRNYVIQSEPEAAGLTYRTLLSWACQITGKCAKMNDDGELELVWYSTQDNPLTSENIFSVYVADNPVTFTGLKINKAGETIYSKGTDGNVLVLTDNLLIQNDFSSNINVLWTILSQISYYPASFEILKNALIEPFDNVTYTDENGTQKTIAVTDVLWVPLGKTTVEAKGDNSVQTSYAPADPMTTAQTEIINRLKKENATAQEAITDMNTLINSATGLYQTEIQQPDGSTKIYLSNKATLEQSTYIVTINDGGFAFTDDWNGGDPVWQYGITKAGNAILNVLDVYKITASLIRTGKLMSNDGSTIFNLDANEFSSSGTNERLVDWNTKGEYKTNLTYKDGALTLEVIRSGVVYSSTKLGMNGLNIIVNDNPELSADVPEGWETWSAVNKRLWWLAIEAAAAIAQELYYITGAISVKNSGNTKTTIISAGAERLGNANGTDLDTNTITHAGMSIRQRVDDNTDNNAFYGINASVPGKLAVKEKIKMGSENYDSPNAEYVATEKYVDDTYANIQGLIGAYGNDVAGISVDYRTGNVERLAGTASKSAGEDFTKLFNCYGGRRRCNVADDGTINAYYGDASYTEDGTNGQVMVYQPKFYYKVVPVFYDDAEVEGYNLRKVNYFVSDTEKPGFKLHPAFYGEHGNPVDYILFSAYEGVMYDSSAGSYVNDGTDTSTETDLDNDLMCSVAGKKPTTGKYKNITRVNFEKMASNRGSGWHGDNIKAESANQLLLIVEYATLNSQAAIAPGIVNLATSSYNRSALTGSTASIGNGTGRAEQTIIELNGVETIETAENRTAVSYRGIENPWGNIWKLLSGINIYGDGTQNGGIPYICDDFNYIDNAHSGTYKPAGFALPNSSETCISAFGYGDPDYDWLFLPTEKNGTVDSPVGDTFLTTSDLSGVKMFSFGGYWMRDDLGGAFHSSASSETGYKSQAMGGRILYVPSDI